MNAIPDTVIILIGIGLAIALPWLLFLAVDRSSRRKASNVWQNSLDELRKTMQGENRELDELAQRVEKLKSEKATQREVGKEGGK